jgi:hypothetical protein
MRVTYRRASKIAISLIPCPICETEPLPALEEQTKAEHVRVSPRRLSRESPQAIGGLYLSILPSVFSQQTFLMLELDGDDLKSLPLIERKAMLAELIARSSQGEINAVRIACGLQINEHATDDGAAPFRVACRMGLEGIVSKKMASTYRPGPKACRSWIKVRNSKAPGYLRVRDRLDG